MFDLSSFVLLLKRPRSLLAVLVLVALDSAHGQIVVGTGTAANSATSYPAPYGNFYWGARHQFLVRATELGAAGLVAGPLYGVSFDVVTVGGANLAGLTIKVGATAAVDLAAGWVNGLATVDQDPDYDDQLGWNRHYFGVPFVWDGIANVVIEVCHANASFTTNAVFQLTATPFVASRWYRVDAPGVCANAAVSGTAMLRPNLRFDVVPPVPPFQTNGPASSLVIDGVFGTAHAPARVPKCVGQFVTVSFASNLTSPLWELGIGQRPLLPAGGGALVFPGPLVLNLDAADPQLAFLNGGVGAGFVPFPGNSTASVMAPSTPGRVTVQMAHSDPAPPGLYSFSQAVEVTAGLVPLAAPVPATATDDGFTMHPIGCFPFYGTNRTRFFVCANGRVTFSAGSSDYSATTSEAALGSPFFGAWCDLSPNVGGTIAVSSPSPSVVRVQFTNVPYHGNPSLTSSLGMEIDGVSGGVRIDGLATFPLFPTTNGTVTSQWIGMSPGAPSASDPGFWPFGLSAAVPGPSGAGMSYVFGQAGLLLTGFQGLQFLPNATGNYDSFGF